MQDLPTMTQQFIRSLQAAKKLFCVIVLQLIRS